MSGQVDALVVAAGKGDLAAVSALIAANPGVAGASRGSGPSTERCPALARAAAQGHVDVVKALLQAGADPNAMYRDDYGTALTAACETLAPGAGDVVRLLLEAGADPVLADALFVGISTYARNPAEKHKVMRLLLESGETADQNAAVLAVHAGDVKLVTACIARDPSLVGKRFPEVDYLAWPLQLGAPTLLHIAADFGETAIVELLLAAGFDANVRSGPGPDGCGYQTPIFHCVASQGGVSLDVLKILIDRRADMGITSKVSFPAEAQGVCDGAGTFAVLNPLQLALRFEKAPGSRNSAAAVKLLRDAGAVE